MLQNENGDYEPTHFSTIGIRVDSQGDLADLIQKAIETAEVLPCNSGMYLRWASDQGAELWIQVDKTNTMVGVTPYFRGKSEFLVRITDEVGRPDDTRSEGTVHGWAEPQEGNPEEGTYPFAFELVGKGLHEPFDLAFISSVQLSAFAHGLVLYDSDEEFDLSQDTDMKCAAESFVPSGLFSLENDSDSEPPQPYATIAGHVLEARELSNPFGNQSYQWMLVRTLGGVIDVVSDPYLVPKPPVVGGVVFGSFWLCGRILEPKILEGNSI